MVSLDGGIVSPELQYMKAHPESRSSFQRVDFELQYIKKREQISGIVAIACTVLAVLALSGLVPGGHVVFGALIAIALIAFLYSYVCRQAEISLRSRQVTWVHQDHSSK